MNKLFIESRMKELGIPLVKTDFKFKKGTDNWKHAKRIYQGENYLIIGEDYMKYCVKLAKLLIHRDITNIIYWRSQSSLTGNGVPAMVDIAFLTNLHKPVTDYKSEWPGIFVNSALNTDKQIIIGVQDGEQIEEAFPYEADQLEELFRWWRL